MAASGLEPGLLTIEVTESTLMRDANATVARLRRLKDIGVMIAIDDFGTGYSSLAYLRQFPVDVLKIDRSFVAEMDGSTDSSRPHPHPGRARPDPRPHHAGRRHRGDASSMLRNEQCDSGQGFIFSRPVEPTRSRSLWLESGGVVPDGLVAPLAAGQPRPTLTH